MAQGATAPANCRQSLWDEWDRCLDETFVAQMGEFYTRKVDGFMEVALVTTPRHRNLSGIVHGGVIMTVLDRVIGLNCRLVAGCPVVTGTLSVNFLNPVRTGSILRAGAEISRRGRSIIFAEARAYVEDELIATASASCVRKHSAAPA